MSPGIGSFPEDYATPKRVTDETKRIRELEGLLMRARTILNNMAWENEGSIFIFTSRWAINHEPLRADAKALLPLIDEALRR